MSSGSRASKKAKSSTSTIAKRRRPNKGSPSSNASARSGSAILTLNDDWSEFLHALISSGTRFLLIGGHAVAIHAEPRFTEDLDVFVEPTLRNARKLHVVLAGTLVAFTGSYWPDVIVGIGIATLFLQSALGVCREAYSALRSQAARTEDV